MVRRRKQTTPRRARASQVSAEAPAADDQRPRDEEARQEAPPDPRERLLALPGIIATRLPNRESLDRLQKFLQENQPCHPQQVNWNLKNKELHIDWQNDLIGANFKNIRLAFAGGIFTCSLFPPRASHLEMYLWQVTVKVGSKFFLLRLILGFFFLLWWLYFLSFFFIFSFHSPNGKLD